jgi:hypothetical protein
MVGVLFIINRIFSGIVYEKWITRVKCPLHTHYTVLTKMLQCWNCWSVAFYLHFIVRLHGITFLYFGLMVACVWKRLAANSLHEVFLVPFCQKQNWGVWNKKILFSVQFIGSRVVAGNKNSPTVTHACRKRRLKWVPGVWGYNWATLSPGVINTETWSSRLGVGHGANNPIP